ncbi:MAG: sodium-independent anion transporter, partial [Sedimenticola sp.]|nr:sodium-independent anion transporter [Sedimenticola sp.]
KRRAADGGKLYLINVKDGLWNALERSGDMETIGDRNVFQSKNAAIHAIYHKLDKKVCEGCENHIFQECRNPPKPKPLVTD